MPARGLSTIHHSEGTRGSDPSTEGITNPPIDELLAGRGQQVRPGHLRRQARPPDQRLLLAARRGPARVRRPAGRDPRPGEAAVDRAARDQRGPADRRAAASRRPDPRNALERPPMRIVLGVGGGIAAYKACELLRLLTEAGHDVRVVPTRTALKFVGAATWAALSGQPVVTEVFEDVHQVPHVRLGQEADLVVVAPATADLMARAAAGLADDLLTAVLLTARCPVLFAPAMHTEMWEHPATAANVATAARVRRDRARPGRRPADRRRHRARPAARARRDLRRRDARPGPGARGLAADLAGVRVVSPPVAPASTWTRCASSATGRPAGRATRSPPPPRPRRGGHAGRRERRARRPGRRQGRPRHVRRDLRDGCSPRPRGRGRRRDGGGRRRLPARAAESTKIKKTGAGARPDRPGREPGRAGGLVATAGRAGQVIVGFAAETGDVAGQRPGQARREGLRPARRQRGRRRTGLRTSDNAAVVLGADGSEIEVPLGPKEALADVVWDLVRRACYRITAWRNSATCLVTVKLTGDFSERSRWFRWPVASSPPSPSPRATRTRSPTRSATRSWTRCSRTTRAAGSPSRP